MYRIIYKQVFATKEAASKEAKHASGIANNVKIVQGKSGGWLVVLYEHSRKARIDEGVNYYKNNGLITYIQEVKNE